MKQRVYQELLIDCYASLEEIDALQTPTLLLNNERAQLLANRSARDHLGAFTIASQALSSASNSAASPRRADLLDTLHCLGLNPFIPFLLQNAQYSYFLSSVDINVFVTPPHMAFHTLFIVIRQLAIFTYFLYQLIQFE